jgi:hypothetical protein
MGADSLWSTNGKANASPQNIKSNLLSVKLWMHSVAVAKRTVMAERTTQSHFPLPQAIRKLK